MEASAMSYPASLEIDYIPKANRFTTFFRPILLFPIMIIMIMIRGVLVAPVVLMILFKKKYPRWWFEWNLNMTRFSYRINAYVYLLTHDYPNTDEEQSVHIEMEYPENGTLSRGLPLIKWLLAIPHFIVLAILMIAVGVLTIIAWFSVMIFDRYPKTFFNFVVGVLRWNLRVQAYTNLLITDKYPPFSLKS